MSSVILLSDLHLSPTHGFFWENFRLARDAINAAPPELVIVNGDLCINGPDSDAEMAFAGQALQGLDCPYRALPGNHDVGDEPPGQDVHQLIDAARIARWNSVFGFDRFDQRVGVWRLLGLDAQLCGSGLAEEAAQWDWLEECLLETAEPVALFLHKPLYLESPDEDQLTMASMNPAPRARLLALIARSNVKLVVSGHLHSHRDVTVDGVRFIWAPALSFVHGARWGAVPMIAGLTFDFEHPDVSVDVLTFPGLVTYDLDEIKGHGRYTFLRDMPECPPDTRSGT
jgi:3',5'-cyclic AMP phosphodiesterase CpdA